MKIVEYQLEELREAKRLQRDLAKLHVPVPLVYWKYEITDEHGAIVEKGIGKANSYTRNGLNAIAYHAGLCDYNIAATTVFGDGCASLKGISGTVVTGNTRGAFRDAAQNPIVYLGESTAAESLDSYATPSTTLTGANGTIASVFNGTTRTLVTVIGKAYTNGTAAPINITEAGVIVYGYGPGYYLVMRDVFEAKTIDVGKSINWTYVTEVEYPNP